MDHQRVNKGNVIPMEIKQVVQAAKCQGSTWKWIIKNYFDVVYQKRFGHGTMIQTGITYKNIL